MAMYLGVQINCGKSDGLRKLFKLFLIFMEEKMKKLFSLFLAVFLIFFSNANNFFAGGEDKIVYLSDGSKMIYVSTERIPEILEEYKQKIIENRKREFSTKKNLSFKGVGLGILGLGIGAGMHIKKKTGSDFLAFAGGLVGAAIGGVAFFWPEWIAHDVETTEEWWSVDRRFGLKSTIEAIEHINRVIQSKGSIPLDYGNSTIEHGIIILERPKSKWGKYYLKFHCTAKEGVDCQNMGNDRPHGNADGLLLTLKEIENVHVIRFEKR
jgi:hypothetical protein